MRGEQPSNIPTESARAQGSERLKDRAELLFDNIMRDVRARRQKGEDITFKTHPDYITWLDLRNQNIQNTPITPAQHAAAKERQQAAFVNDPNNRRIAAEQDRVNAGLDAQKEAYDKKLEQDKAVAAEAAENAKSFDDYKRSGVDLNKATDYQATIDKDQAKARELLRKISGEKLNAERVSGIISEMNLKLLDYKAKGEALQELGGILNYFNRKSLIVEMNGVYEQIKELCAVMEKEFSKVSLDESKKATQMMRQVDVLKETIFDTTLKDANAKARINWAMGVTVLAANLAGACTDFQANSRVYVDDKVTASRTVEDKDIEYSETVVVKEAGYRVAQEPIFISEDSTEVVGNREVYKLTEDEAAKVNNFTQWRRAILKPEFIGDLQKDGTIPTTEKGRHTEVGTKVLVAVDSKTLKEMVVEKGSSIWKVLDENKDELKALAKANGGFKSLNLWVESPVEKKVSKSEGKSDVPKHAGKGKRASKEAKIADAGEESAIRNEQAVRELLAKYHLKMTHELGKNYTSVEDYETAEEELKNVIERLDSEVGPVLYDTKPSAKQMDMIRAQRGLQTELSRLGEAKKALRINQHQQMINNEDKIPQPAAPEAVVFAENVDWQDLAKEDEIKLRAGEYTDMLLRAYNLIARVDLALSTESDEAKVRAFYDDAKNAKKIYGDLLKPETVDSKFPSRKFILKQAEIGLKLADKNIKLADDALPKENLRDVMSSAKDKFDALFDRNKNRTGNIAIFGAGKVMEIVQLVVANTSATGKISNPDKKQLRHAKKQLHIVLNSKNNSTNDYSTAKELLDIIDTLNRAVSKKDQDIVDAAESKAGVRYETPKQMEQGMAKNLDKLLSGKVKDQINQAYELANNLLDDSPSSAVAYDLVSAAALLEQLLLRPMESEDIQDKLIRAQGLILETQAKVGNSKIYPREYAEALSHLNSAFIGTRDSLIETGTIKPIDKQVAPVGKTGKRVATAK